MKYAPLAAIAICIVLSALGAAALFARDSGRADPDDAWQVAQGAKLYAEHCASCHGTRLEGQLDWQTRSPNGRLPAPPHDASGHTWHHSDDQLFRLTKTGVKPPLAPEGYESDMPGFADVMSDRDIWAVLAFIKSSWPAPVRSRQQQLNKAAAR